MRVLLIDDEENLLLVLEDQLSAEGFEVTTAIDGDTGLKLIPEFAPDIIVTDLRMEGKDGIEVTSEINKTYPDVPVIVLTAYGEVKTAVDAMKAGAVDFLTKPVEPEAFVFSLKRAVEENRKAIEQLYLKDEISTRLGFIEFIGESDEAKEIRSFIDKAACNSSPVIITGETGVGKELVARLIHAESERSTRPFLIVNCRETSGEYLLEDLFGRSSKQSSFVRGKFEVADGGTVLLDDITSLPSDFQGHLLNVIENGIVEPGGGRRPFRVDIRFIVTSNEDIGATVKDGEFRSDLYHRLNVLSINLPNIASRKSDISQLAKYFIELHAREQGRKELTISDDALTALSQYDWPGNARELSNMIERAIVMNVDGEIKLSDLPIELIEATKTGQASSEFIGLREKLLAEERRLILKALEKNSFVQRRAAKSLGISRSLLNQKIKRLGIEVKSKSDT